MHTKRDNDAVIYYFIRSGKEVIGHSYQSSMNILPIS
jgi:hypothetical protein